MGVANVDFTGEKGQLDVIFDTTADAPLADVSGASPAKWGVRVGGVRYHGTVIGGVDIQTIHLNFESTGPDAGPDEISYSNAPSDIGDVLGRVLKAFVAGM